MGKRVANKQLTQDNFDKSDSEDDETSTPKVASEEVLKTRVIKTAKRRLAANDNGDQNIFAGFKGFGTGSAAASDAKPSFSFASSTPAPKPDPDAVFRSDVVKLNDQFVKWAEEQLKKSNKIVDLTPCMKNYMSHMEKLKKTMEEEKGKQSSGPHPAVSTTPPASFSFTPSSKSSETEAPPVSSSSLSGFSFGSASAPAAKFSFGSSTAGETKATDLKFSFGAPAGTTPASMVNPLLSGTSTISFGLSKPSTTSTFSFGLSNTAATSKPATGLFSGLNTQEVQPEKKVEDEEGEEEEEEKEQQNFQKQDIKESDAFFEARTKLYYLAGKEFKSRGIGNLFLKDVGGKVQLVVRADNTVGNLLLNVIVKNVNPKLEDNKKSVSMWCIPNPTLDTKSEEQAKPTKLLFTLADPNLAKELAEHLEKNN